MGKVIKNDHKSAKNRARVRKHRLWKKNQEIHEKYIHDQVLIEKGACNNGIIEEIFVNDFHHYGSKVDKASEIEDKLKYWCVHHRITTTAMNDLLNLLRFAGLVFFTERLSHINGNARKCSHSNVNEWQNVV